MAKGWRGYNNTQTSGTAIAEVPGRLLGRLTPSHKELGFLGVPFGIMPSFGIPQEIRAPMDTKWKTAGWGNQHLLLEDFKLWKGSVHACVYVQS